MLFIVINELCIKWAPFIFPLFTFGDKLLLGVEGYGLPWHKCPLLPPESPGYSIMQSPLEKSIYNGPINIMLPLLSERMESKLFHQERI